MPTRPRIAPGDAVSHGGLDRERLEDDTSGVQIEVEYFAAVRELAGVERVRLVVERGDRVSDLAAAIEAAHPLLRGRLDRVRFAINEELSTLEAKLREGDVVAVIPPVAGGSEPLPVEERVSLSEAPLVIDATLALVRHRGAGALATFVGVVRDQNEGRRVTVLEYSAHASMAKKEMARIVRELEAELPGVRLAVAHRIGVLEVGDDAVICAASAPHRGEAFEAGRALIDRIKERVPIWKRERGDDGDAWIGWD